VCFKLKKKKKNRKSMIQGVINIKRSICRIENRSKTELEEAKAEQIEAKVSVSEM
jgi:hypothetical protein